MGHTGKRQSRRVVWAVLGLYMLCFALRWGELFWPRTDQTFWGEAFLHKLAGIGILLLAARLLAVGRLGFRQKDGAVRFCQGLALGLAVFALAYGAELLLLAARGQQPALSVYVSAYGVNGNLGSRTEPLFFLLCLAGNAINVAMEEGLFRGLFQRLLERRFSFLRRRWAAPCCLACGISRPRCGIGGMVLSLWGPPWPRQPCWP